MSIRIPRRGTMPRMSLSGPTSALTIWAPTTTCRRPFCRLVGAAKKTSALPRAPLAGQVLMVPCLVRLDCYTPQLRRARGPSVSSQGENRDAPVLPRHIVRIFLDLLNVNDPKEGDLMLNPGNVTVDQVKGLPPTTICVAGLDPLRDKGLLYASLLWEAG